MLPTAITGTRQVEDYRQSIQHAGGEARIVDPSMPVAEALEGVGGLLLTGGEDVAPELYGEAPHPTVHVNRARDDFEIALIGEARRRDLPILGICRGIQVLNVARGGTLVQDIPSEVPGALEHKLTVPPNEPFTLAHEVWVEDGSVLAQLISEAGSSESPQVNSRHHQAVKKLGEGLVAVATAPDGVIEAVEDPTRRFCVGVQWHPENFYRTGEFRALFEGFIKACRI